jgi:hypothetical protein
LVVDGCLRLLTGANDGDAPWIAMLGGPAASWAPDPADGFAGSSRWQRVRAGRAVSVG